MDSFQSKWTLLALPFALNFFLTCLYCFSAVFSDALFLSSYPRSWLTYSFLILPLILVFVFFVVSPFLAKASNKQSFIFVMLMALLTLFSYHLLSFGIYIMPFILTLLLATFGKLISIIGLNAIAASFEMQVYKRYAFYFNLFGIIGAIATSLTIPLIIYFFHNSGVFYATLISMILSAFCILKMKQIPAPVLSHVHEEENSALHKQAFFNALFMIVFLASVIDKLTGFAFKASMIGQFSQDNLAMFISVYMGATNLICLLIQFFLAGPLLLRIGLMGMLFILPCLCVFLAFGIIIWPIFPMFVLMRALFSIGEISFKDPCLEMIINPFPSIMRKKISFILKGYANAISGLMGALFILIVNRYLPLNAVGMITIFLSTLWIYFTFKAGVGYRDTLFKALKENRYDPDLFNLTPESVTAMHQDILNALRSQDPHIVRAALNFFDNQTFVKFLPDGGINQELIEKLSHPEKDIRYNAVIALKKRHVIAAKEALLSQMEQETDREMGFAIMGTLLHLGAIPDRLDIDRYLESDSSVKQVYAMIGLDRSTDPCLRKKLEQEIACLIQGDIQARLTLASAFDYLQASPEQNQRLMQLLQDESVEVSIQAIHALKSDFSSDFVMMLISMLDDKKRSYAAEYQLTKLQDQILDSLLQVNLNTPFRQRQAMLRLLARLMMQPKALYKLLELSQSSDIELRLFIANQALRFSNVSFNDDEVKQAIIGMIGFCASEIECLLRLNAGQDCAVLTEIHVQLYMNRQVFVAWFSILTDKYKIASVAHYIERPDDYENIERAKAYELLDSLSTDIALRQAVNRISQDYRQDKLIQAALNINPSIVMLAQNPYQYQKGSPMNTMEKSALLRRVKLFDGIPVQSLLVIAAVAHERDMLAGELIFKDKDPADRFYCIASGEVMIKKGETILSELSEADYFGELGLLDNMPRTADAIAKTDGALLYIDKQDFVNVLEDLPQMMRAVMGQIIKYLRQNLNHELQK